MRQREAEVPGRAQRPGGGGNHLGADGGRKFLIFDDLKSTPVVVLVICFKSF